MPSPDHWAKQDVAKQAGNGGAMKQRLMELYFAKAPTCRTRMSGAGSGRSVGLDPAHVRADLAAGKDVAEVEQEAQMAKNAGIKACRIIFGGKFAVSGAQAPEYLAEAITKATQGEAAEVSQQCRTRECMKPSTDRGAIGQAADASLLPKRASFYGISHRSGSSLERCRRGYGRPFERPYPSLISPFFFNSYKPHGIAGPGNARHSG